MKIIFFGSDGLAIPALRRLVQQSWCELLLVVTPPDQPAGRRHELKPTAIKQLAIQLGLPISHDADHLPPADVGVVVYYGIKIQGATINHFPYGLVNIHPSLLPCWRGPSPIKSALLHGDVFTGVTIMLIDSGFDTGPILAQNRTLINGLESATELEQRLGWLGAELLIDILPKYISGSIMPKAQSNDGATMSKFITKSDGLLQQQDNQLGLWNRYRALQPWPGAFFVHENKRYKITAAHWSDDHFVIDDIQPEGKKSMPLAAFKRGYPHVSFANII